MRDEPADTATARDLAATALVLGIAGYAWFGWAQAGPPTGWAIPLGVASTAGILVALPAGVLVWRWRRGPSAMAERSARRRYNRAVVLEVALIGLGALVLGLSGRAEYTPAWTLFIVGAHFPPLARLFVTPGLNLAAAALVVVALAAAVVGLTSDTLPSTVAGAGGGAVCVLTAAAYLRAALRTGAPEHARSNRPEPTDV